jgi:hypothetical protein
MIDAAALRQLIRAEVRAAVLEALAEAAPRLTPEQSRLVEALGAVYGPACFSTRELVATLAADFGDRPAARQALIDACGAAGDRQRVGQCLAGIARQGGRAGRWRLQRVKAERGASLWGLIEHGRD